MEIARLTVMSSLSLRYPPDCFNVHDALSHIHTHITSNDRHNAQEVFGKYFIYVNMDMIHLVYTFHRAPLAVPMQRNNRGLVPQRRVASTYCTERTLS